MIDQDVEIVGDLTVRGDAFTVETSAVKVEDPLLSLGLNNNADTFDMGWYGRYALGTGAGSARYAGLFRDRTDSATHSTGIFLLFHG